MNSLDTSCTKCAAHSVQFPPLCSDFFFTSQLSDVIAQFLSNNNHLDWMNFCCRNCCYLVLMLLVLLMKLPQSYLNKWYHNWVRFIILYMPVIRYCMSFRMGNDWSPICIPSFWDYLVLLLTAQNQYFSEWTLQQGHWSMLLNMLPFIWPMILSHLMSLRAFLGPANS